MDYLERAFDDAKYGWYSEHPYIDCAIQSTIDPDMAPPGKHVLSCFVQYTPYTCARATGTPSGRPMADRVQATLERYFPGFGDLVLQREVQTPLDIERTVGLSRGQHLRRRVPGAADVLLPTGTGLVAVPDPDRRLLPVRLGHPPGRLRDGRAGAPGGGPDPGRSTARDRRLNLACPVTPSEGHCRRCQSVIAFVL